MMTFGKTVLAYLTGWLIVQPLYNRLVAAWRRREMKHPSAEMRFYWREQAKAIVDELHHFTPGQEPPVALAVILAQHTEIERLKVERDALEVEVGRYFATSGRPADLDDDRSRT